MILCALFTLLACGGSDGDGLSYPVVPPYPLQDAAAIGSSEQAMTANDSQGINPLAVRFAYGSLADTVGFVCTDKPGGGQSCQVPGKKAGITWCISGAAPLTSPEVAQVNAAIQRVSVGGFTFTHFSDGSQCDARANDLTVNLVFDSAALVLFGNPICPDLPNQADGYACRSVRTVPTSAELINGTTFTPLPGAWGVYWTSTTNANITAFIHLQRARVARDVGSNIGLQNALEAHAFTHALLQLEGIGARTDNLGLWSSRKINVLGSHIISTGELCRMQSFNPSNPSFIGIVTPGCPTN